MLSLFCVALAAADRQPCCHYKGMKPTRRTPTSIEICILAAGLSSRMGRDKSKLLLGGRAILTRIRETAKTLHCPVRVIRRDRVPRCGPLGGIYTALKTTGAGAVLFLACDMPKISHAFLEELVKRSRNGCGSIFVWHKNLAGFPFVVNQGELPAIEKLLHEKKFSLQQLSAEIRAKKFRPQRAFVTDLLNVNTPEEWARLQQLFSDEK